MNWANRTVFTGDNLDVMRGMNSESVDLIYADPPFNSNRNYAAPIGSEAAGAAFKDTWTLSDIDVAWLGIIADHHPGLYKVVEAAGVAHGKGMQSYLCMMGIRLLEMRRILKTTGSAYLHCDPTASHYLKTLMDTVFGTTNFRNEIVWCYRGGGVPRSDFARKHDIILRYSRSKSYLFNVDAVRIPYSEDVQNSSPSRYDKSYRQNKTYEGYRPNEKGKHPDDWWTIQPLMPSDRKERLGYPTQKPIALLDRIIAVSSNHGDVVFDPFCGCATALVSAEKLGRQWVGIDISPMAVRLVRHRLYREVPLFTQDAIDRTDVPRRSDLVDEIREFQNDKHVLYGQQEGHCNGCGGMFEFRNLEVDHVVPRAKGGSDHISNYQLLCGFCNRTKGTGSQEELLAKLRREGIIAA